MKIQTSCSVGSYHSAVLTLDGQKAVEGVHYAEWAGRYHKNGKWSYTESGVALKNGGISWIRRSTHSGGDWDLTLVVVKDDEQVLYLSLGKVKEMELYPEFEGEYADLLTALFEAHLSTRPADAVAEYREKWAKNKNFF